MAAEHETLITASAKALPPVTVSLATFAGVQVSELVLWATLIYTMLLIMKTLYRFYCDVRDRNRGAKDGSD